MSLSLTLQAQSFFRQRPSGSAVVSDISGSSGDPFSFNSSLASEHSVSSRFLQSCLSLREYQNWRSFPSQQREGYLYRLGGDYERRGDVSRAIGIYDFLAEHGQEARYVDRAKSRREFLSSGGGIEGFGRELLRHMVAPEGWVAMGAAQSVSSVLGACGMWRGSQVGSWLLRKAGSTGLRFGVGAMKWGGEVLGYTAAWRGASAVWGVSPEGSFWEEVIRNGLMFGGSHWMGAMGRRATSVLGLEGRALKVGERSLSRTIHELSGVSGLMLGSELSSLYEGVGLDWRRNLLESLVMHGQGRLVGPWIPSWAKRLSGVERLLSGRLPHVSGEWGRGLFEAPVAWRAPVLEMGGGSGLTPKGGWSMLAEARDDGHGGGSPSSGVAPSVQSVQRQVLKKIYREDLSGIFLDSSRLTQLFRDLWPSDAGVPFDRWTEPLRLFMVERKNGLVDLHLFPESQTQAFAELSSKSHSSEISWKYESGQWYLAQVKGWAASSIARDWLHGRFGVSHNSPEMFLLETVLVKRRGRVIPEAFKRYQRSDIEKVIQYFSKKGWESIWKLLQDTRVGVGATRPAFCLHHSLRGEYLTPLFLSMKGIPSTHQGWLLMPVEGVWRCFPYNNKLGTARVPMDQLAIHARIGRLSVLPKPVLDPSRPEKIKQHRWVYQNLVEIINCEKLASKESVQQIKDILSGSGLQDIDFALAQKLVRRLVEIASKNPSTLKRGRSEASDPFRFELYVFSREFLKRLNHEYAHPWIQNATRDFS